MEDMYEELAMDMMRYGVERYIVEIHVSFGADGTTSRHSQSREYSRD
jgi:hypothetical protein